MTSEGSFGGLAFIILRFKCRGLRLWLLFKTDNVVWIVRLVVQSKLILNVAIVLPRYLTSDFVSLKLEVMENLPLETHNKY